jgi:hypothetical protein
MKERYFLSGSIIDLTANPELTIPNHEALYLYQLALSNLNG